MGLPLLVTVILASIYLLKNRIQIVLYRSSLLLLIIGIVLLLSTQFLPQVYDDVAKQILTDVQITSRLSELDNIVQIPGNILGGLGGIFGGQQGQEASKTPVTDALLPGLIALIAGLFKLIAALLGVLAGVLSIYIGIQTQGAVKIHDLEKRIKHLEDQLVTANTVKLPPTTLSPKL